MGKEAIKKNKLRESWRWKNLGKWTGATDVSITNRIKETEKRISGIEGKIEETDTSAKGNRKSKIS